MEEQDKKNWHDKSYKYLLIIPAVLILFSIIYLSVFYSNNGAFFNKDISLTGGTSVSLYGNTLEKFSEKSISEIETDLSQNLKNMNVRIVQDIITKEQKEIILETQTSSEEVKSVLEDYLGLELIENENSNINFTGSSFGEGFYKQLIIAVLIAFLFMAIVVFILFRDLVPSGAVIISAFADILMTLVTINLLGIKMSGAGIIALLMLIGYSVDTDILLTNRVLKHREGSINKRISGAFKTGMTMTLTSLFAMTIALIVARSFSEVLTQIFTILVIGLVFDMLNTWITNVSILKWHMKSKEMAK